VVLFLFVSCTAPATTEIYTLSLHDALPISAFVDEVRAKAESAGVVLSNLAVGADFFTEEPDEHAQQVARVKSCVDLAERHAGLQDRKSTRLNSSHVSISYAVFCLKKKTKNN